MSVFIIENKVTFDPDKPSLAIVNCSPLNIPISAAAARCLVALIDAAGEPVSRENLLHAGWGAQGSVVSENSLNQAVTQLRKVLKELELDGELIMTVPRLGYKISHLFSIEQLENNSIPPIPESLATIMDPELSRYDAHETLSSRNLASRVMHRFRVTFLPICMIMAGFIFFWMVNKSAVQQIFTQYYTVDYLPLKTHLSHLKVFFNQGIDGESEYLEKALQQLENDRWLQRIESSDVHFIYINGSYNPDVFSYFLCRKEIQHHNNGCEAYTSIQEGI